MSELTIRLAEASDFPRLTEFMNRNPLVYRHLDWKTPLEWIGEQPFLLAEDAGELRAILVCVPYPTSAAWIRVFATLDEHMPSRTWRPLFAAARDQIRCQESYCRLLALNLQGWFAELIDDSGFEPFQDIVMLEWNEQTPIPDLLPVPDGLSLRLMTEEDLPGIYAIDRLAFQPIWQYSLDDLSEAFEQSAFSTVAEMHGEMVGYQISACSFFTGHLARLGVHPAFQRHNIGFTLVHQLLNEFKQQGTWKVTVNTQSDNLASLSLYEKIGFLRTGEAIHVYQYPGV